MNFKLIGLILITFTIFVVYAIFAFVPPVEGLGYLVRIAFFHIPVAWVSVLAFLVSAITAAQYLKTRNLKYDHLSAYSAKLGLIFCLLAVVSGAIFAKLTWGAYWNWDPRQTTIFILCLIYGAYLSLRPTIEDEDRRATIAAVYALMSFLTVPFLVFVIPRMYFSLHPEPVLNSAGRLDMDTVMLYVLLAAVSLCSSIYCYLLAHSVSKKFTCTKEMKT
ncbi:cytochrome c biogenesis protein [Dendrosporobacter sp. 1207_IL3150]|uniref:cytochrome c biogenesis protein n=1 Tax=Dendrosporobacter sp. 1207_IL3150 TaxID=3084054 RepID=UPI002FDA4B6A